MKRSRRSCAAACSAKRLAVSCGARSSGRAASAMAFDVTFSFEPRMLVLRLYGPGDSREGHRAFQDVQGHPEYFQGVPILIDAREVTYPAAPTDARVFTPLFATAFP